MTTGIIAICYEQKSFCINNNNLIRLRAHDTVKTINLVFG